MIGVRIGEREPCGADRATLSYSDVCAAPASQPLGSSLMKEEKGATKYEYNKFEHKCNALYFIFDIRPRPFRRSSPS